MRAIRYQAKSEQNVRQDLIPRGATWRLLSCTPASNRDHRDHMQQARAAETPSQAADRKASNRHQKQQAHEADMPVQATDRKASNRQRMSTVPHTWPQHLCLYHRQPLHSRMLLKRDPSICAYAATDLCMTNLFSIFLKKNTPLPQETF